MIKKLLFLTFSLLTFSTFSQCDDLISMGTPILTNASCQSNGAIEVTNVLPVLVGTEYLEYSLFNNATSNEVYTWQNSNIFPNLQAGSYQIRVRRRCSVSPYSSVGFITNTVTISNTEISTSISSITVLRNAKCNNGEVTAVAVGSGPLQYALVSSLTETEPIAAYIRPLQPTSRFADLPAGNYFMRVYNACNNASTIPFTIDPDLSNTRVTYSGGYFVPVGCDSVSFSFNVAEYIKNIPNFPNDVNAKAWVRWPSGTVDSIVVTNQSNSNLLTPLTRRFTKQTHISELDPAYNPLSVWPSNLSSPSYPIIFGYKDVCGALHIDTFNFIRPTTVALIISTLASNTASDCDNLAYRFSVRHSGGGGTTTVQGYSASQRHQYSLDNGATWVNVTTSNNSSISTSTAYTDILTFPRGVLQNIWIKYCDTIVKSSFTPSTVVTLSSYLTTDALACLGKGRIRIRNENAVGSIMGIRVLSKPAAQPLPSYFPVTLTAGAYTDPVEFSDLMPGSYTIELLDTIGVPCQLRRSLTIVVKPFTFDFNFNVTCNKNLEITNLIPVGGVTSGYRASIINNLNVPVIGGTNGIAISTVTNELSIPGTTLASLPNGTYTIRVARALPAASNYTCLYIDKLWIKNDNNNLNLNNSVFVSGCEDGFGAVGASASGGTGPYEFTLLDLSDNIIAPTTPGANTYNGLIATDVYKLRVTDACGAAVNRLISANSQIQIASPGYSSMPCLGNNITLTLPSFTGVTYAWMKDGVLIPSATTNLLPINNLALSDSGAYQSTITIGGCDVSGSLYINPADCGGPLAVELSSFAANCESNGSVTLNWKTASELNSLDFILQKSADLINWEMMEILPSKGNSSVMNSYSSIDRKPFDGVSYYQLIQRDIDGITKKISPISSSCENDEVSELKVYPNPTTGDFMIELYSEKQTAFELQILDVNGRLITSKSQQLENAMNFLFISENLMKGVYILKITTGNKEMAPLKLVVN